jgi:hypothetical protein
MRIHHVGNPPSGFSTISNSIELLFEYEKMRVRLAGGKAKLGSNSDHCIGMPIRNREIW